MNGLEEEHVESVMVYNPDVVLSERLMHGSKSTAQGPKHTNPQSHTPSHAHGVLKIR